METLYVQVQSSRDKYSMCKLEGEENECECVTSIGANNGTAQSLLKQEYKDDITVEDAIGLVMWTMTKMMDSTMLSSKKHTFLFLSRNTQH